MNKHCVNTKTNKFEYPNNITVGMLMYDRNLGYFVIVPAYSFQQEIYNIWVKNGKLVMDQSNSLFEPIISELSKSGGGSSVIFSVTPRPTKSICNYQTETHLFWLSDNPDELYAFKGYATRLNCPL